MSVCSKALVPFTFPFMELPFLPLEIVIGLMDIGDIVRLLMTSKRLEWFISTRKYKIIGHHVHFKNGKHQFEINRTSTKWCNVVFDGIVKKESVGTDDPAKWFKFSNPSNLLHFSSTDSFDDVIAISKRIRSYFKVGWFSWKLFPDQLKSIDMKELISKLSFEECYKVWILEGSIDIETLSSLMDEMESRMWLTITSDIPTDFHHEKALTFSHMSYDDAKWITLDALKSLSNIKTLSVKQTNFDNEDINNLLHHWSESNEDMFEEFNLKLKEGVTVDRYVILEGFIRTVNDELPGVEVSYFLAKQRSKKLSLARVVLSNESITLGTRPLEYDEGWITRNLELLERNNELRWKYYHLFNEEKEWINELMSVDNDSVEREELHEKIRMADDQKMAMEEEFNEIVRELETRGVTDFVNLLYRYAE